MAEIIVLPDFQKLKDEVAQLKARLAALIFERDDLKFVVCRNIEARYLLQFGSLEYEAYEAEIACKRAKRKAELIRAKLNRKERVSLKEVEKTLDDEMEEYAAYLKEKMRSINDALEYSSRRELPDKEGAKLKKLYREIVKAVHPDLNPSADEEMLRLFAYAAEAYKNGDVMTMQIIHSLATVCPQGSGDRMKMLLEEKKRLSADIQALRDEIASIKQSYPYTMRQYLEGEDAKLRKQQLQAMIFDFKVSAEVYQKEIDSMTGGSKWISSQQ